MGYTDFLIMNNSSASPNLPEAIEKLEEASVTFMYRWQNNDLQRAGEVSKRALVLLDHIANELLRNMDRMKGTPTYLGSSFAQHISSLCGEGVKNATISDQRNIAHAGPGNGLLPTHLGTPIQLKLSQLLNKIKHRRPDLMNFRFDNGRHIFMICTDHTGGGPEGIYEFDVKEFCASCRVLNSTM